MILSKFNRVHVIYLKKIDSTCFSNFSQDHMFCNDNCFKLVPDSTRSGVSSSASNNFWKIFNDFLKILDHGNYHSSILAPGHVHTQVLMYITPSYFGPIAEYPTYPGTERCDGILLNVRYLQIIYVSTHGHLGTIYQFIGFTWVIWVHFEPFFSKWPLRFL